MFFIRRFEETLLDLFSLGKLVGTTHTYIGQEANAIGVIDHLDPDVDTIFSNHRCHGHYLAFTDDAFGLLCEVMGKAPGVCGGKGGSQHLCKGNFYSNGVLGSIVPVATGHRARGEAEGNGRRVDGVPRRRHARRGRDVRVAQHRLALAAPGALRRREQPLRAVHAGRARAGGLDRGARSGVRHRDGRARHDRRRGDPRRGGPSRRAHPRDGRAVLPRPQHLSLQPALEVGRPARPRGDRGAAHARPAARRWRAAGRRASARRSRRAARSGSPRPSRPRMQRPRQRPESQRDHDRAGQARRPGPERGAARDLRRPRRRRPLRRGRPRPVRRCVQGHARAERRVSGPRPHDADQRGVALRRRRRDGVARAAADPRDHVRRLHRARARPGRERDLEVPRDVRRPGDGAARRARADGRAPRVRADAQPVAREAPARDPEHLRRRRERVPRRRRAPRRAAVDDERPVFFIENKLLYGRPIRRPEDGHIGELAVRETGEPYPALTFSATDFTEGVGDRRRPTAAWSRSSSMP